MASTETWPANVAATASASTAVRGKMTLAARRGSVGEDDGRNNLIFAKEPRFVADLLAHKPWGVGICHPDSFGL
jgi:hypothetical protein